MPETITLRDYANTREYVVAYWASTGSPVARPAVLGEPDLDFTKRNGLDDLQGTIGEHDTWYWDGSGDPKDDWKNSITSLYAYPDQAAWESFVDGFHEGD